MLVLERRTYVGPNLYALFPVIRLTIDLGPLEEWPSAKIPGFVERLLAVLPTLDEHTCSYGHAGGFVKRLTDHGEGTWMGHVLEHVAIELQNLCGIQVTFGKTRGTGEHGRYHVVYQYQDRWVGAEAGDLALRLLHSLIPRELVPDAPPDPAFDFHRELETLILEATDRAFGPSTASLVRAAEERDIPWIRIGEGSLVQFGHGRFQRRIQATVTSETNHIAVDIASDKELTNQILGDLGLPVPKQFRVRSAEKAVEALERIGGAVVVKPLDGNHGRGVSIGLSTPEQVSTAFAVASEISSTVLVEQKIEGHDYRLLVINGELVAAAQRVPGHVVGDGRSTVLELIERVNADPRRGIGHEKVLTRLELDHQAIRLLQAAGLTPESVIEEGRVFYLRSTGNLSTGGTAIDVTDVIHPDNRDMAVRAVKAIGLDVCGVDFLTPDITRSYTQVGGGICEVNAAPGFRMHVAPSEGRPRDAAGAVMDMLFPPGRPTRIPIAAITGTNGKTTTTRMLAHMWKLSGACVGMTTTDGVYLDGLRTVEGDMTGPISAQMVLRDPSVGVAVLETARGGLLRSGMGYRKPNVACVLNVTADHLGLGGIHTLEQLAEVKRIPIEAATDCAVLNADDDLVLRMAGYTNAKRVCYVTTNPSHALVREHIRAGGMAVALEGGINGQMIAIYDRNQHIPLLWTHLIPATLEGRAMFNVQNAMFASAMGYAMGLKLDDIRHGLRTFDTTFFQAPGRMNVFDELGFKVILDYGHNEAAVDAMCSLVDRLVESGTVKDGGKRVVILSAPGDRRDEDLAAIARRCAWSFDQFIVREDDDLRGRPQGEIPDKMRSALIAAGARAESVRIVPKEQDAVDAGLRACQPGDLLLVFADKISRSWKQIIYFGRRGGEPSDERAPFPQPVAEPPATEPRWVRDPVVRDERGVVLQKAPEASD
jgi:cyanophycin synthetase